MRAGARRALGWGGAIAAVLVLAVVAFVAFAPDDRPPPASSPTTREPGGSTTAPGGSSVPSTTPGVATTVLPRSPIPEVRIGYVGELASMNGASTAGRTPVGVLASSLVLPSAFVADPTGVPQQNTELLSAVAMSPGPPMSVTYTVAPGATWSDGTPIGCNDFVLAWIAGRGDLGEDGRPLFQAAVGDYDDIGGISCDGQDVLVLFRRTSPGWQLLFSPLVPSSSVLGAAGLTDLTAARDGDGRALAALAQAWNGALVPGAQATVSGGPFAPSLFEPGRQLVLERSTVWWGAPPTLDRVVLLEYPDDAALVQALASREVDLAGTALGPAAATAAGALPGVRVEGGSGAVFDHLVVNLRNPLFQDRQVRQALARCVPRGGIVEAQAGRGESTGALVDDHLHVPFQAGYRPGSLGQAVFDPDAGRAILADDGWVAGAGGVLERDGKKFSLRVLRDDSARSADVVARVREACGSIGIEVLDDPVTAPERDLRARAGDFDVVLAAGRARLSPTAAQALYATRAADNLGDYSSPAVDALFLQLGDTLDPAAQAEIQSRIDAQLWDDLPTIPLGQPPAVVAVGGHVVGVVPNPTAAGLTWNAATWIVTPT